MQQTLSPEQKIRLSQREECLSRYFIDVVQFHKDKLNLTVDMNPSEISILCAYLMSFMEFSRPGIISEVFLNALNRFRRGIPLMIHQYIEENGPLGEGACPVIMPNFTGFSGERPNIKCYLGEPESVKKQ